MPDNKKKWMQPQLIILGRGTPEENVLLACKTGSLPASVGATNNKTGCRAKVGGRCDTTGALCSVISATS